MSTLKRETQPSPSYAPSILPQHEKADGTFEITGENNPLPMQLTGSSLTEAQAIPTKPTGSYMEHKGTISVGAGASVVLLDHKKLENRAVKSVLMRSGSSTTYKLTIKKYTSDVDTMFYEDVLIASQAGSNGYQNFDKNIECAAYSLIINDLGGAGFTAIFGVKERV